jgi:hypothetical protein
VLDLLSVLFVAVRDSVPYVLVTVRDLRSLPYRQGTVTVRIRSRSLLDATRHIENVTLLTHIQNV